MLCQREDADAPNLEASNDDTRRIQLRMLAGPCAERNGQGADVRDKGKLAQAGGDIRIRISAHERNVSGG